MSTCCYEAVAEVRRDRCLQLPLPPDIPPGPVRVAIIFESEVAAAPAVGGELAATALEHEFMLVARNERDIARTGARVLNPFSH